MIIRPRLFIKEFGRELRIQLIGELACPSIRPDIRESAAQTQSAFQQTRIMTAANYYKLEDPTPEMYREISEMYRDMSRDMQETIDNQETIQHHVTANCPNNQLVQWARNLGFATGHADTEQDLLDEVGAQIKELQKKYNDLLCEVASKFPDETRHETALRYIRNAEKSCKGPAQ